MRLLCPLKPCCLPHSHFSDDPPYLHPPPIITVSSCYLCLCLMGSPCFGSIADVVQSHGGVFMDSSYPSSPVTGPLSRGQRRASEVSMASQVSGMADSYTATNIANSKCSYLQQASLPYTHTHTLVYLFPLLAFIYSYFCFSIRLSTLLTSLTLHTPCTQSDSSLFLPGQTFSVFLKFKVPNMSKRVLKKSKF